jgi:tetratricopeptide (TPR) repeat protein
LQGDVVTAASWQRLKALFQAMMELPENERAAFLDRACASSAALRADLESLMAGDSKSESLLESLVAVSMLTAPPAAETSESESTPESDGLLDKIGPYEIQAVLGEGGLGTLYRARGPSGGVVALRVLRVGPNVGDLVSRFNAGRPRLESLQHPNFARLLDAGVLDDGRPYYAAEFVEGLQLTAFAEKKALTVPQRVELLQLVCGAVQYAHQRLVAHGDLRTGNILVTADGAPKLVDFGIASVVNGEATSTEADLTALAAFLREFAAGAVDPARTFPSAAHMAEALEQYLAGGETKTIPPRRPWGIAALALLSVVALAAAGFSFVQARRAEAERTRAEQRTHEIRRATLSSLSSLADGMTPADRYLAISHARDLLERLARDPQNDAGVRRDLAAGMLRIARLQDASEATVAHARADALDSYRKAVELQTAAAQAMPGDVQARRELAAGLDALGGRLLGNGDIGGADQKNREALQMRTALARQHPGDPAVGAELAQSYFSRGLFHRTGVAKTALENFRLALAEWEKLKGQGPAELQRDVARCHEQMGALLLDSGDPDAALEQFRLALVANQARQARQAGDVESQLDLAATYADIAAALERKRDRAGALENGRKSLDIAVNIATGRVDWRVQQAVAAACDRLGRIAWDDGDRKAALGWHQRALDIREELVQAAPWIDERQARVAESVEAVAAIYDDARKIPQAREAYLRAIGIYEKLTAGGASPAHAAHLADLRQVVEMVGAKKNE